MENAIIHNGSPSPTVRVRVERADDVVTVSVTDNGPKMERTMLTDMRIEEEEDLFHSSGLGRWFVYWTVQRSHGVISASTNAGGKPRHRRVLSVRDGTNEGVTRSVHAVVRRFKRSRHRSVR